MENLNIVLQNVQSGCYSSLISKLYPGQNDLSQQQERICKSIVEFSHHFGENRDIALFSTPGRTEIAGNHTDHQHGCVVAASVDLDIVAVASANSDNYLRIISEGYPMTEVNLNDLSVHDEEKNSSISLIRGVAAGLKERGYKIGGFDAYMTSNVLKGSGLSSSAAYEVMLGTLFSGLYNQCDGKGIDPTVIAHVGQYAENKYFGKPAGLMDQMACSVGGYVAIDFYNPEKPIVEKIDFDFASCGHTLCIVDTGGNHTNLTHEYADVNYEMKSVCREFGKEVLREIPAEDFYNNLPSLCGKVSDRAIVRAHHFFTDNIRAQEIAQALREKNFERFMALSNASGRSSTAFLQNIFSCSAPEEQSVNIALAVAERLLAGSGALRIHGGGFGGTIQVFVPNDRVPKFQEEMEKVTGKGSCHLLSIRLVGSVMLRKNG